MIFISLMRLCLFTFLADELASFAMRKAEILANKYGKLNYHIGGKINNHLIFVHEKIVELKCM